MGHRTRPEVGPGRRFPPSRQLPRGRSRVRAASWTTWCCSSVGASALPQADRPCPRLRRGPLGPEHRPPGPRRRTPMPPRGVAQQLPGLALSTATPWLPRCQRVRPHRSNRCPGTGSHQARTIGPGAMRGDARRETTAWRSTGQTVRVPRTPRLGDRHGAPGWCTSGGSHATASSHEAASAPAAAPTWSPPPGRVVRAPVTTAGRMPATVLTPLESDRLDDRTNPTNPTNPTAAGLAIRWAGRPVHHARAWPPRFT